MYSTYRLKADELTNDILNAIKSAYQNKEIEIIVQDIQDETEYLLCSDANKEHLLKAVKDINNKENLVNIKMEDL
jgi:antitoxin YefM